MIDMTNKRKIVKSEGCRSWATMVDGKNLYGEYEPMTEEQRDELTDYLCARFKEEMKKSSVSLDDLIACFQYESCETEDGYCETCGDSVTETTWLI